jgi:hypothetical protein
MHPGPGHFRADAGVKGALINARRREADDRD